MTAGRGAHVGVGRRPGGHARDPRRRCRTRRIVHVEAVQLYLTHDPTLDAEVRHWAVAFCTAWCPDGWPADEEWAWLERMGWRPRALPLAASGSPSRRAGPQLLSGTVLPGTGALWTSASRMWSVTAASRAWAKLRRCHAAYGLPLLMSPRRRWRERRRNMRLAGHAGGRTAASARRGAAGRRAHLVAARRFCGLELGVGRRRRRGVLCARRAGRGRTGASARSSRATASSPTYARMGLYRLERDASGLRRVDTVAAHHFVQLTQDQSSRLNETSPDPVP